MNNYVLFSCVGTTDPIRDNYDGAMLHIIRYYRPHTVYIFLTKEMGHREEKDHRFSKGVQLLSEKLAYHVDLELIFSQIENPHDFDVFIGVFSKHLEEVSQRFPNDNILLNISSGTPQMTAMLCLETIGSSKPLIPVQVTTPVAKANVSKAGGTKYDVEWEFQNNLDNEPDAPKRCLFPDILSFKRALAKGQVLALVKKYNYEEAAEILRGYGAEEDSLVMMLLKFANYKKNLDPVSDGHYFSEIKALVNYPKMDKECMETCEYFNVVKLLQRTRHLTGFVLRLNPLVTKLQSFFLENSLGFPLELIIEKRKKHDWNKSGKVIIEKLVKRSKIKAYDEKLLEYIDQCYHGEYRDNSHLNIRFQNCLISYLLKENNYSHIKFYGDFLKAMEELNQEQRNPAAHHLCGVFEEDIENEAGMSSSNIVNKLENLIKIVFKNRCKHEIFDIFDKINAKISDELERT